MAARTPYPFLPDVERVVDRLTFVVDHRTARLELRDEHAAARAVVALLVAELDNAAWWTGLAAEAAWLKTDHVPDAVPHAVRWAVISRYAVETADELAAGADESILYAGPVS